MHVLCAPPAFILSQDQTLLLLYLYFRKFLCYIINLFKIIYLDFFRFISFFKNLLFGTTFRLKCNYRLVLSLKDLLFTFQCTFSFFMRTIFIILCIFFFVNTFLKFLFCFCSLLGAKKLVMFTSNFILLCFNLLLIHMFIFNIFCLSA